MMIDIESQLKIIYGNYLDFTKGENVIKYFMQKTLHFKDSTRLFKFKNISRYSTTI